MTLYPAYKLRILATNHLLNLYPKCDVYCHQVEHIFLTKQPLIKEMWNVKRSRYTRVSGWSVKSGKKQRLGSSLPGISCSSVPVLERPFEWRSGEQTYACKTSPHGFLDPINFFVWNPVSGKSSLVDSEILGFEIRNIAHDKEYEIHIQLRRGIQSATAWISLHRA